MFNEMHSIGCELFPIFLSPTKFGLLSILKAKINILSPMTACHLDRPGED
jgi:hypothetical protein